MANPELVETPGATAARVKLSKFADRHEPRIQDRNAAARELFARFEVLSRSSNLSAQHVHGVSSPDPSRVQYTLVVNLPSLSGVCAQVLCAGGQLFIGEPPTKLDDLEFNPVLGRFEGRANDGKPIEDVEALGDVVVRELGKAWDNLKKPR